MIRQAENIVRIEGILSEVDLNYGSFTKKATGEQVNSIGGSIKIQVNQNINGVETTLEVPVHMFASEYTNKGTKNPAYQNIEKIKNEFTPIAAAGGVQGADAVRITNGKIVINEFPNRMGEISSYPRINASFINKIRQDEMKPEATFTVTFAPTSLLVFFTFTLKLPCVPGATFPLTNDVVSTVSINSTLTFVDELSPSKFHFATVTVPDPVTSAVYFAYVLATIIADTATNSNSTNTKTAFLFVFLIILTLLCKIYFIFKLNPVINYIQC